MAGELGNFNEGVLFFVLGLKLLGRMMEGSFVFVWVPTEKKKKVCADSKVYSKVS